METGATPPVDIYPFLHWLPQRIFLHWRDRATHVQRSMNSLYSSFLSGLRSRRAATGSRGSLMDKVLDQVESEKAAAPGMTYSDHELWFLGGTLTEGDFRDRLCRKFAQEVEKRTNGALKFQIYPGSSLMKTNAQFSALQWCAITMNAFNRVSVLSGHPVRPRTAASPSTQPTTASQRVLS